VKAMCPPRITGFQTRVFLSQARFFKFSIRL
jgi:hypothetical protein